METTVRPARPEDVLAFYEMVCDLERQVLDEARFHDIYNRNLSNPAVVYLVAESGGEPVGMVSCHVQLLLHHAAPVGEIQEMYVRPDRRSLGVGGRLLSALEDQARQRGLSHLEVTSNRSRSDTHRFYERQGFVLTHVKLVGPAL